MSELEITGEQLRRLSEESVRFYLALGQTPEKIAQTYRVELGRVEKIIARLQAAEEREAEKRRRTLQRAVTGRPMPPDALMEVFPFLFKPAPDLAEWVQETFLEDGGALCNPEHAHLASASIGFLWTNIANSRQMRRVVGQAEIPSAHGGKWTKGRHDFQLEQWFGVVPDFLITLDAPHAAQCSDLAFCALVEHELFHCAQARDMWGGPRYDRDGNPQFAIRGHDAEEFIGVVRRYGVGAAAAGVAELVRAAGKTPLIGASDIASACGTCLKG